MELKHISAHLPYGLKVRLHNGEVVTFTVLKLSQFLSGAIGIKPILRPLSDLTKPIEHNGERFVPIYKLWELAGFEIGRGQYITDEPNYIKTSNLGTAQEFVLSKSDILSSNYNVIQKLLEWKFDIFNLIGKGEAIDVNTLQTNPYK